ncbi:MAG: porin [Succinivibrio sp.]
MKKSLLITALLTAAVASDAATIYEKNDTSLKADGRVQAVIYNGDWKKSVGDHDANLQNSARFGMGGSTKTGIFKFTGYTQWDMADANSRKGNTIEARDQYVEAEIKDFGSKLRLGRYKGAIYSVTAVTDIFDDFSANAQNANDERNSGRIEYTYTGYGFEAKLGYLTAVDNYVLENGFSSDKKISVEGGASAVLGYTFSNIPYGPLSIRAGYEYIKGQNDYVNLVRLSEIDDIKGYALSVSFGDNSSGFYTAALYNARTYSFENRAYASNAQVKEDLKNRGIEFVVGYTFNSGVSLNAGYNVMKYEQDKSAVNDEIDCTIRSIPLYVKYKINPNFMIWSEAMFDVTSDDDKKALVKAKLNTPYTTANGDKALDTTFLSVGARYTF